MPGDIELRPFDPPRHTKQGIPVLDEVVATGVDLHMEQMSDSSYWFVLRKGGDEWHFWISSRRGAAIDLICTEEGDTDAQ